MSKFPYKEDSILALCKNIEGGMSGSQVFVGPPLSVDSLRQFRTNAETARVVQNDLLSQVQTQQGVKTTCIDTLTAAMREILNWAEDKVDDDDAALQQIGWSGRKTPEPMTIPDPPMKLQITEELPGTISMTWDKPQVQGNNKPDHYEIQRREKTGSTVTNWEYAGFSREPSVRLTDQPCTITLEYQVVAVNNAGKSVASNIVEAVL